MTDQGKEDWLAELSDDARKSYYRMGWEVRIPRVEGMPNLRANVDVYEDSVQRRWAVAIQFQTEDAGIIRLVGNATRYVESRQMVLLGPREALREIIEDVWREFVAARTPKSPRMGTRTHP